MSGMCLTFQIHEIALLWSLQRVPEGRIVCIPKMWADYQKVVLKIICTCVNGIPLRFMGLDVLLARGIAMTKFKLSYQTVSLKIDVLGEKLVFYGFTKMVSVYEFSILTSHIVNDIILFLV